MGAAPAWRRQGSPHLQGIKWRRHHQLAGHLTGTLAFLVYMAVKYWLQALIVLGRCTICCGACWLSRPAQLLRQLRLQVSILRREQRQRAARLPGAPGAPHTVHVHLQWGDRPCSSCMCGCQQ